MTRKDYELIAQTLRYADEIVDEIALEALAEVFANALVITNPAFDRARFLKACGVN
jgi:hypothetical protein